MRRLSLATANAFLICYATTSAPSFGCVKQCFEEIREQRADFQVKYIFGFLNIYYENNDVGVMVNFNAPQFDQWRNYYVNLSANHETLTEI